MEAIAKRPNPYVGPRAYQTGEALYGRDRDILRLYYLLLAERIVLFFSPSGAGKTSLIQAGLIPKLGEKFSFIPVVRVNLEPPEKATKIAGFNRYIFSVVSSMEELQPDEKRLSEDELAGISLTDYLTRQVEINQTEPEARKQFLEALIFDQFEEILTTAPNDYNGKDEFFKQVGEALKDGRRWALFSAREDYSAAFEPFTRSIPTRFSNRYRLDLLTVESAMEPIQKPANAAGVDFTEDAALRLVEDLSMVKVQRPDGTSVLETGRYVEPVQLQVVCYRLWNNLADNEPVIGEKQLITVGSVNDSLAAYYTAQIEEAEKRFGVAQRIIRDWINNELITSQGIRSQIILEPEKSGGLDNRVIQFLVAAHLLRAEKRAGSTWFELAHDRLIEPIRLDNARWLQANLVLFQQQANLWEKQDRPESLLLGGKELNQARIWAGDHKDELLSYEQDYLEACKEGEARTLRLKRRNQIISILGLVALVLAVVAFVAYKQADFQRAEAQRQERVAKAGQLAAQSHNTLEEFPQRSILLSLEALKITQNNNEPAQAAAEEALRTALDFPRGQPLGRQSKPVTKVVFSPVENPQTGGGWLASASEDGSIFLWDRHQGNKQAKPIQLSMGGNAVRMAAISPDERWLAAVGDNQIVWLWDLTNVATAPIQLAGHSANIKSLAFDPQSNWLATGGIDENILLWNLRQADPAKGWQKLSGHSGDISTLAFSPDGQWLASGSLDSTVRLWDMRSQEHSSQILKGHSRNVDALAFSPDGNWLASGSYDHTVILWNMNSENPAMRPLVLGEHEDIITALAFSPGGNWLATGSADHTARLWDLRSQNPGSNSVVLRGHADSINSLAFSPGGKWLATGSTDHAIRLWDMTTTDPAASPVVLRGHDDQVTSLAFSPDGLWLVSGGKDHSTRIWSLAEERPGDNPLILRGHTNSINVMGVSPDGHWLASGSEDKTVRVWDLKTSIPPTMETTLQNSTGAVSALIISPDSRWLASGGVGTDILIWDLNSVTSDEKPIVLSEHGKAISQLAFSPGLKLLASGDVSGKVELWESNSGSWQTKGKDLGTDTDHEVTALAFSPNGKWLAAASGFGIRLWNMEESGAGPLTLSGHENRVTSLAFSPDSQWLATGGMDNAIRLWDLSIPDPNPKPVVLTGQSDWVLTLAFSPKTTLDKGGRWLASGSKDKTAMLWDMTDLQKPPIALRGHDGEVTALAFSPQADWLATISNDRTARLWNLKSPDPGNNPVVLRGHEAELTGLAFLPEGNWLLTASNDKTLRLWQLDLNELKKMACELTGRNLSLTEWEQYLPGRAYDASCPQWPPGK